MQRQTGALVSASVTGNSASVTGMERYRTIQEEFFCPEDARPGDVIGVTTEAGTTAEVVIPDGVECGEAFLANVAVPAEWAQERSLEHDEAAAMPHISPEELARRRRDELRAQAVRQRAERLEGGEPVGQPALGVRARQHDRRPPLRACETVVLLRGAVRNRAA